MVEIPLLNKFFCIKRLFYIENNCFVLNFYSSKTNPKHTKLTSSQSVISSGASNSMKDVASAPIVLLSAPSNTVERVSSRIFVIETSLSFFCRFIFV